MDIFMENRFISMSKVPFVRFVPFFNQKNDEMIRFCRLFS